MQWAGLDPKSLRRLGSLPVHGQKVPLLNANIWLHHNRPGSRDEFAEAAAWQWEMDAGIAVCPPELGGFPRLPLIGLRAVQLAGLHVAIDGSKSQVSIRTRRRLLIFD